MRWMLLYFQCIVRLNNRCHPDMIRDFVNHGTHDPEEYPFLEELHALRRLLATLYAMRNWEDFLILLDNSLGCARL